MAMAALPQELIEDILSRLPVKSLLRFKSVSKNWYYLISKNHNFAKLQFQQSASKNLIFYELFENKGPSNQYSYYDVDSSESRMINFTVERGSCRPIGSANGLICVAPLYKGGFCYIWNPCTGDHKRISLPMGVNMGLGVNGLMLFGFGYDSISDDYKIIGEWDSHLQIFSLKTNSWRKTDCSFQCAQILTALHSNGALHWCNGRRQITAFDLATDGIFSLDLPEEFVGDFPWVPLFVDYQGSLLASGPKSIWVMKEYGNTQSWAKLSMSLPKEDAIPVNISRLGELVFRTALDGLGLVKSDIQGKLSDDAMSRMFKFGVAFVYKESLISPGCFDP